MAEGEIADRDVLERMTANKGPAMEAVRNQYLSSSQELRAAPPLPIAVNRQMVAAPAVGS